jgi:hypothetical protein
MSWRGQSSMDKVSYHRQQMEIYRSMKEDEENEKRRDHQKTKEVR